MPMLLVHKAHLSSKGFQQLAQHHSHSPTWSSQRCTSFQIHAPSKQMQVRTEPVSSYGHSFLWVHILTYESHQCAMGWWSQCRLCSQRRPSHASHVSFLSFCNFLILFSPSVLTCKLEIASTPPPLHGI